MEVESLVSAVRSFHQLPPDVLPRKNMRLVDPKKRAAIVRRNDPDNAVGKSLKDAVRDAFATGLFSVSEIAFDREHSHALVSYGFRCGSLCGSGATVILEKVGDVWKKTDRMCGGWVS